MHGNNNDGYNEYLIMPKDRKLSNQT